MRRAKISGRLSNWATVMHLLSGNHAVSKNETGLDILTLQKRIVFEQALHTLSCRKIRQNMLHGNPHIPDNRFSAKNTGAHCNSFEQIIFTRHHFLLQSIQFQLDQLGATGTKELMKRVR